MAAHSSTLAWRIPGRAERGGLPSMGSRRVGHDWSDLAAAAAAAAAAIRDVICHSINFAKEHKEAEWREEQRVVKRCFFFRSFSIQFYEVLRISSASRAIQWMNSKALKNILSNYFFFSFFGCEREMKRKEDTFIPFSKYLSSFQVRFWCWEYSSS